MTTTRGRAGSCSPEACAPASRHASGNAPARRPSRAPIDAGRVRPFGPRARRRRAPCPRLLARPVRGVPTGHGPLLNRRVWRAGAAFTMPQTRPHGMRRSRVVRAAQQRDANRRRPVQVPARPAGPVWMPDGGERTRGSHRLERSPIPERASQLRPPSNHRPRGDTPWTSSARVRGVATFPPAERARLAGRVQVVGS